MERDQKYNLSYGKSETFDEKIDRLESYPTTTYLQELGVEFDGKENERRFPLFHGLRFYSLDILESIFQTGKVVCGRKVPQSIHTKEGEEHFLHSSGYVDNCNQGKYVSVMPFIPSDIEFLTFVAENVFLVFKGSVPAKNTFYLKYEDFIRLQKSGRKVKNLYSYAFSEYMVEDSISLENLLSVGISNYLNLDSSLVVPKIVDLMEYYDSDAPFRNISTGEVYYQKVKK